MEHPKILHLLNEDSDSKFVTRKWNNVNDQSNANYDVGNEIISNLCDYDAYVLVRRDTVTTAHNDPTPVAFKNCATFIKYITKIDGTAIDDAEDLNLVMPMCNLVEYSSNYSATTGSLWFYSKDEVTNFNADIVNNNNFKSFGYNAKLLGNTEAEGDNGILKTQQLLHH